MFLDDEFPITMEREAGMPDTVPQIGVSFGPYYQLDATKTREAGHEVYKDVIFVKIAIPGDKNSLYFQPATEIHKRRFPQAWAAYNARKAGSSGIEGLPVEQWAPIGRSAALTLKAAHIHTVEALAEVHDGLVDRIGANGRELREKAKAFLAQAKDSAATMRLASEKKALQDELAGMRAQIFALTAMVNEKKAAMPDEVEAARTKRGKSSQSATAA